MACFQVSGHDSMTPGAKKVSFPFFVGFISLLNHMDLIMQIHKSATSKTYSNELTRGNIAWPGFLLLRS